MLHESKCDFCGAKTYRKIARPRSFCDNKCKGEWQKLQRPVSVEWLREKYIAENLDCTQIGALCGRDPKSVWNWLKGSGIPTRPRGSSENWRNVKPESRIGRKHSEETKEKIRQAKIKDGRVPYLKNGVHHLKGKRGADCPNWKGGITPDRQLVYSSEEWKECVKAVWRRDNATCQRCGKHKSQYRDLPFDIHHIKGFEHADLRTEVSNLVLLCEPCHYWTHSKQNTENKLICR